MCALSAAFAPLPRARPRVFCPVSCTSVRVRNCSSPWHRDFDERRGTMRAKSQALFVFIAAAFFFSRLSLACLLPQQPCLLKLSQPFCRSRERPSASSPLQGPPREGPHSSRRATSPEQQSAVFRGGKHARWVLELSREEKKPLLNSGQFSRESAVGALSSPLF